MRCKAKSRKGEQCKNSAVPGKEVCRFHGGLSLSGTASPRFKHGRYSKVLPQELLGKYQEARRDPDLLNLRDEISLNDVRLQLLVEKLPAGGGVKSWAEINQTWNEFIAAQQKANTTRSDADRNRVAELLRKMNDIVTEGSEMAGIWQEIDNAVETRRRLTASEARRLTDMQQIITAEKAIALVYAILDIIRRNILQYRDAKKIVDDKLLSSIAGEVRNLVTIPTRTDDTN